MNEITFSKVRTICGSAGGASRLARVTLEIEGKSDTVEAIRELVERAPMLAANDGASDADRNSLDEIQAILETALPFFKGCPAPDDWTKAALRELIEQRDQFRLAAMDAVSAMQNMRTGAFKSATSLAKEALKRAKGEA